MARRRRRAAPGRPGVCLGAHRDAGSGTVLVVGLVAVVVVLAVGLGALAAGLQARSTAQTAADLAALAAAGAIAVPPGVEVTEVAQRAADPCGRATQVAARNGAEVIECVVESGGVVQVTVRLAHPTGAAQAQARAGPASARERG